MVQESLARKFHPAGFEQPEDRKGYVKPRRELQNAFYQWTEELPKQICNWDDVEKEYRKACKSIRPLGEIPYRETNSLLVGFKPESWAQRDVGLFASACYNQSPEPVIVFDLNGSEIDCIGYRLGKSKILVNHSQVGKSFGWRSLGIIINNGEAGSEFAEDFSGISIALQEPEDYGISSGKFLKPDRINRIPDLKEYLEEFCDMTKSFKDDELIKRFLERYGTEPKKRIEQDIKRILGDRRI